MLRNHHSKWINVKLAFVFSFLFILIGNINAQEIEKDPPLRFVEETAEPIGGMDSVYKFIRENIVYPEKFKQIGLPVQIFVEFIIEEDGSITRPIVLVGIEPELDKEVIRVLKMLPPWKPGKHKGINVRSLYTIPIRL
jgi:protein TonB